MLKSSEELKSRLEPITGVPASKQALFISKTGSGNEKSIDIDDAALLSTLGLQDLYTLIVGF